MSRGKRKTSLSDLSRQHLTKEDHPAAREELLGGTDRSAALVGCALVDASLVSALATRLIAMSEDEFEDFFYSSNAPCSSFSARIKMGKAIGIYGLKVTNMLDSIRRVRNVFAHSAKPLKFSDELIIRECAKLPDAKLQQLLKVPPSGLNALRERYTAVCMNLVVILEDHAARHSGHPITIDIPDG